MAIIRFFASLYVAIVVSISTISSVSGATTYHQSTSKSTLENNTFTYVRCWYRKGYSHNDVSTDYEWAKDKNGKIFSLPGYWWASGETQWKNMFYTDVSQDEIAQRCRATLGTNIPNADILFFAADNRFSLNNTIWTNDRITTPGKINKIIAFGDSISDTGNLFNGLQWRFPNRDSWFLGHFSNGLVWTEYIARAKNIPLYNWAVGSAAGNTQYSLLSGVKSQIDSYKVYVAKTKNYDSSQVLFTLEFGLNDFMNYNRSLADVEADFSTALVELETLGAKNLILMKLPDASKVPQFKYARAEKRQSIRANIDKFNRFIEEKYHYYVRRGMSIYLFDAFSLFEQLTSNPKSFGFVNASDACMNIKQDSSMDYMLSHSLTYECYAAGSDKYVFWGITHPTTAVHKYIAEQIISDSNGLFNYHR